MSEFQGHVICPACEGGSFYLEIWNEYVSIACRKCGFEMRQLDLSWFSDYPKWKIDES